MNWFQIVFYLRSCTTQLFWIASQWQLWIGFRLYFIFVLAQPICEGNKIIWVVNWFQIVFYLRSCTTTGLLYRLPCVLWIGFRLYFIFVLAQLFSASHHLSICCELVSDCILSSFLHNVLSTIQMLRLVVNWFQIVFYLRSCTTQGLIWTGLY